MLTNLVDHPWRLVFPAVAVAGLASMLLWLSRGLWTRAFLASSAFIAGLLATMAAGLYPDILPARAGNPHGLTVANAAAGGKALDAAMVWWPLGMALAVAYFAYSYRAFFTRRPATGNGE
jgi:cytochrome d ubiquinol oxidase subunit II